MGSVPGRPWRRRWRRRPTLSPISRISPKLRKISSFSLDFRSHLRRSVPPVSSEVAGLRAAVAVHLKHHHHPVALGASPSHHGLQPPSLPQFLSSVFSASPSVPVQRPCRRRSAVASVLVESHR